MFCGPRFLLFCSIPVQFYRWEVVFSIHTSMYVQWCQLGFILVAMMSRRKFDQTTQKIKNEYLMGHNT